MATAPKLSSIRSAKVPRPNHRSLKILIVDEELPYPLVSGKRIRTMGLLQRLARRHQITYVCHRNSDEMEAMRAQEYFAALGIRTLVVDRVVPPKNGPGFYGRLFLNLFSSLPYSVQSHISQDMLQTLEEISKSEEIDLWHCEWSPYAEAVRHLPGRKLFMAHNVESMIWQRYHENEKNPLKRWYIGRQVTKFVRFERNVLKLADMTVAVSENDACWFQNQFDINRIDVVDNGVDTEYFQPKDNVREPATLLFLGSLDWRPNQDGIEEFLRGPYPALQSQNPDIRLLIVGRNPPVSLCQKWNSLKNVEVHPNVDDVRPFLSRSSALVVPLRIGGGSRLKILEALACGTPVISTEVGAEGLRLVDGVHFRSVSTIRELVTPIMEYLTHPDKALCHAKAGCQKVRQEYDWESLALRLEDIWFRCVDECGPMLRYMGSYS